jgi:biotin/lipoate A/B protein ligase family protein
MPLETKSRLRTPFARGLDLPPPFRLVTLCEVGDAFAHAAAVAADDGAGTLVHVGRFDLAEFAVVLEPDEPLRTARRAIYTGICALGDALAANAPPEKPISFDWPDAIRATAGSSAARVSPGRREPTWTSRRRDAPAVVRIERMIAAAPERPWQLLTGVADWPSWQKDIEAATLEGPFAAPADVAAVTVMSLPDGLSVASESATNCGATSRRASAGYKMGHRSPTRIEGQSVVAAVRQFRSDQGRSGLRRTWSSAATNSTWTASHP